ncbi:MAG: hypothetical protein HOY71_13010, partial [Nonomuraea sp.]|nr:hypothetical protein [Nonomuraea sp.]
MTATLVLHWALDALGDREQAVDSSPNHLNGMVSGSPDTLPDERFGSCLAFDGKYDLVGSPATPQLRLPAYTLEAWVLPERQAVAAVGVVGMPTRQFRLIINGNTFEHRFSTMGAPDDGHVLKVPVKFGVWQHVAVTYEGLTARAYVDGVDAGTYTSIRPKDSREAPLFAG